MERWRLNVLAAFLSAPVLVAACAEGSSLDDVGGETGGTAGKGGAGGAPSAETTRFRLTLENRSGSSELSSAISPGVFATHEVDAPFFAVGMRDREQGLEALAEDGAPHTLFESLQRDSAIGASGLFDTPAGTAWPAPAMPGSRYEMTFEALPHERLSFATMFAESNDVILAPAERGIALFDADGSPLAERDVSGQIGLWDVGTEADEAPGMGPNQAPRQPASNTGRAEGVASLRRDSTRALPLARRVVGVWVYGSAGTYMISMINWSRSQGALVTALSPLFFATHSGNVTLFAPRKPASAALEALAEDGSTRALVAAFKGMPGVDEVGSSDGTWAPGATVSFRITADESAPYLSLATRIVESNDAFLATPPSGVRLLDAQGRWRSPLGIQTELRRVMAVWDAGTEANEVPGAGANQSPRQPARNTGAPDPYAWVRRYADATNDLVGPSVGGFVDVAIHHLGGLAFRVTITNTSGDTAFPGALSPIAWAVHNEGFRLFSGERVTPGLESLAEDGDAQALVDELAAADGVATAGVSGAGLIPPRGSSVFEVQLSTSHPLLSIASMIVPSNDTFLGFGPGGIELVTAGGVVRSDAIIARDVGRLLAAWDAGTEQNEAGAAGPNMAGPGLQPAPNSGAGEGDGLVRLLDDPVWSYPIAGDVLKVTIAPD